MKNIVLIGMPGAGKSTLGVVLAKILRYQFIDADLLIQHQEGKILEELIVEKGIEGFLAIENQVNRDIDVKRGVISTGGSAVYCKEAMEKYHRDALVVYLQVSYETLSRRLGDLHRRGVVIKKGSTLLDLYKERVPLYEQYAHLVVDVDHRTIEEAIREISSQIQAVLEAE